MDSGRTHKASSAESILRHCLRQRGWTSAWKHGRLTGRQQLALLEDIRQYARAWLRHEAENLFDHYGQPTQRGLASSVASGVSRFFRRARQFVHETIVAGALAFSGPKELTADDFHAIDHQARVQAEYMDRFERDVQARTPPEIASPIGQTVILPQVMSAPQFVARAEQYGDAPWGAAQTVQREKIIRGKVYIEEKRVHGLMIDDMCPTCMHAVAKGWQPIGTLPAIGDSECLGNCHCSFRYRDANGKEAISIRPLRGRKARLTRRPVPAA